MPSHLMSIEDLAAVSEAELGDMLRAYYDALTCALSTWDIPLQLQEPAKGVFGAARRHIGHETKSILAWGLEPWPPIANRTPAELLREPGGDQVIMQAFAEG